MAERHDLRTPPYNKERAVQYPYDPHSASSFKEESPSQKVTEKCSEEVMSSENLPTGTQGRFLLAASIGYRDGFPLNMLLTVNWSKLLANLSVPWSEMHPYNRAKLLVEKIRKFLTRAKRRVPVACIWVREAISGQGEHLHVALHLPTRFRTEFIEFLERALGEPVAQQARPIMQRTKGEIACSANGSWHVGVEVSDGKPEFSGYWLAAYLAKAEPSQRMFRGRQIDNVLKRERGQAFGGRIKGERYDSAQGFIEGTRRRKGRFSISRSLTE